MASVSVHPPKTPVTKGSMGIAKATTPNVCKMPGPPAPFVPTPLPNIGRSALSPKGYSTTVKIESNPVAIFGASFESQGDIASKGTGGGLLSSNTHGPTKFVTPGSPTVKIQGKSVHLLGEPMLNNCGPSGSPPNTGATLTGVDQSESNANAKENLECGEVGTYAELKKKGAKPVGMERDHIPSLAALFQRAKRLEGERLVNDELETCVYKKLKAGGMAVAIPKSAHRKHSPTYGGRNKNRQHSDSADKQSMKKAVERDTDDMQSNLHPECKAAYANAAKKLKEHDNDSFIRKCVDECGA